MLVSFVLAGIAAGLSAICYAEMASAVPVSGSTYSYAYTTMGEFVAMGVAACLLLEYGVSISAVAVGWSGYLNKLLDNLFGWQTPAVADVAAPWDATPGIVNLPAVLLIVMCMLLLIRGASESATVNTVMVLIKLGVLATVHRHRVHRVQHRPLRRLLGQGLGRHHRGREHDLLLVHRPRRGLHSR